MPIYEYRCENCKVVETIISLSVKEARAPECWKCGRKMGKMPAYFSVRVGWEQRHPNHPDSVQKANEERRKRKLLSSG